MKRLAWICAVSALLLTVPSLPAQGSAACPIDTPANPDNLLLIDAARLGPISTDSEIVVRLFDGQNEMIAERYRLAEGPLEDGDLFKTTALPLYLGALAGEKPQIQAKSGGLDLRLELSVDGAFVDEMSLADVLAENAVLAKVDAHPLSLASIENLNDAGVALASKAIWTCPNSTPFCDNQFFQCMAGCSNYSCRLACMDERDECQFGRLINFNVQRTLISYTYQPSKEKCGYYPWWDILDEKRWRAYDATYRNNRTETRYCETTGQNYTFLASTTYDYPTCYVRGAGTCSSASYMGGECRWSAPGG